MAIDLMTAFDGVQVPTRADPVNFPARGDDMMSRFPTFQTQINTISGQINLTAIAAAAAQVAAEAARDQAQTYASDAAASAAAAAASSGATKWISGTNYAEGAVVWSPTNKLTYRAKVALNPSTVDPVSDATNWQIQVAQPFNAIEVLSISANTSLTTASKNVVRVTVTVRGASVLLPSGTALAGLMGMYVVKNIGDFALPVRDQDGTLLSILPKGATGIYTLEDASTSAGVWGVIAPESRPAMAYAAATAEAATVSWVGVSEIPGVANKALVGWITGTTMKVAIATRNASTGAVTLGATLALISGLTHTASGMLKALTSTTALAAGYDGASHVYSLSLNTSTDVVTTTGNLSFGAATNTYRHEHVQQLDSTRVAWLVNASGTHYLNIATYAATPTAAQTSLAPYNVNSPSGSIVHVGGGNILGVSTDGATLFTTSGNTPTAASTVSSYSNVLSSNAISIGFAPGSANRATFAVSVAATSSFERDYAFTITPSGTTIPATGPNALSGFPSMPLAGSNLGGFIAGTSYCLMSSNLSASYANNIRVMRYTDAQLSEVAVGAVDGMPAAIASASNGAFTKAAAVSGQACIAITMNRSSQPQVFSMEVIKA